MFKKMGVLTKLLLGIVIGIIIGLVSKSLNFYVIVRLLNTFSTLFGTFLNYTIPLIIIAFVAPGIAELGNKSGKLLGITVVVAYASTIFAGMLAFLVGITVLPHLLKGGTAVAKSTVYLEPFFNIQVDPIMGVMTALVTAFVLGIGMAYIKEKNMYKVTCDFKKIVELIVKNVIITGVPIYICGIFAKLSASGDIIRTLKAFSAVYVIILPLQVLTIIIQYTAAWVVSGKSPIKCIKNMLPGYLTAVGTQSSAATIPVNLQCAKNNNVSDKIADFVIPLCATIHLAGDTITLVVGAMGIMIISGKMPTAGMMIPYIFMLGITMIAAPGIPGGGAYAALGLLKDMLMFNSGQQGLMIAIHFAQDSFGTATNVCGDGARALIVDKIFKNENKESAQDDNLKVENF